MKRTTLILVIALGLSTLALAHDTDTDNRESSVQPQLNPRAQPVDISALDRVATSDNRRARRLCLKNNEDWRVRCRRECADSTDPHYDACALTDHACQTYWLDERSDCWRECQDASRTGIKACLNTYPSRDD